MTRHWPIAAALVFCATACGRQEAPAPPPAAVVTAPAQSLLVVYEGTLPCADCSAIHTELSFYAKSPNDLINATFVLRETYVATKDGDRTVESRGRWTTRLGTPTEPEATVFQLNPDVSADTRSFLKVSDDQLVLLDRELRAVPSKVPVTLTKRK